MQRSLAVPLTALLFFAASAQAQGFQPTKAARDSIVRALGIIQDELALGSLPAADSFSVGNRTIESGAALNSAVGVYGGSLTLRGELAQNIVVVNGDLVLAPGALLKADAVVVHGKIVRDGGAVAGSAMILSGDLRPRDAAPVGRSAIGQTRHELGVTVATLAIVLILGIGALMFGKGHLSGTAEALELNPGKSFAYGFLGQLAMLPTLAILLLCLALTVIGILLIPFAIVAFFLAAFGIAALGVLATAMLMGTAISGGRSRGLVERRRALRALIVGVFAFSSVWLLAAAVTAIPVIGTAVKGFAIVMTWVATTAGFGAAILSRAGRRKSGVAAADPEPEVGWQTPTPVAGVAAARRPVSTAGGRR